MTDPTTSNCQASLFQSHTTRNGRPCVTQKRLVAASGVSFVSCGFPGDCMLEELNLVCLFTWSTLTRLFWHGAVWYIEGGGGGGHLGTR